MVFIDIGSFSIQFSPEFWARFEWSPRAATGGNAIEAAVGCNGLEATEGMPSRYHKPGGGGEAEAVSRFSSGWLEEEGREEPLQQ